MILSKSTNLNDQKNANLLKQIIFSKEFAKILKIGFNYYEPKLHGGKYVESLVRVQDAFFNLLASHAKDRILSAKTDKLVKRAAKLAKTGLKTQQGGATDAEMGENEPDGEMEVEEEEGEGDDYVFKERRYNYYSEFSSFVDYPTVQKILMMIRGEKIVWNTKKVN